MQKPVLLVADYVGSTAALLNYATQSDADTFIVVTEPGILHQMAKDNPSKRFIPAPRPIRHADATTVRT